MISANYILRKKKINYETKEKFDKHYGAFVSSISMFKKQFTTDFLRGPTNINDSDPFGRSNEASRPENVEEIHDMMLAERRVKKER